MEFRTERETDWNALIRGVLLLGLTAFLARLILTGDIASYIHPKFTWFTASAGVGLVLMAAGQLVHGLRGVAGSGAPIRGRLYAAVTAVICMGLVLQPHTFGADLAQKQGLNLTNRSSGPMAGAVPAAPGERPTEVPKSQPTPQPPTQPGPLDQATAQQPAKTHGDPGQAQVIPMTQPQSDIPAPPAKEKVKLNGDTAVVTAANFVDWMKEFYDHPAAYEGKRVVIEGFTFYPPDSNPEEFAVTRLVVTCHVAHAYPDGLLATAKGKPRPAQDTWHRVEGKLELVTYQNTKAVLIRIEKMTPITMPADPYVYP